MKPRNGYSLAAKFRNNAGPMVHKHPPRKEWRKEMFDEFYEVLKPDFDEYEVEVERYLERTEEEHE